MLNYKHSNLFFCALVTERLFEFQEKREQQRQAEQQNLQSQAGQELAHPVSASAAVPASAAAAAAAGSAMVSTSSSDSSAILTDDDFKNLSAPVDVMLAGLNNSLAGTDAFSGPPQQPVLHQQIGQT